MAGNASFSNPPLVGSGTARVFRISYLIPTFLIDDDIGHKLRTFTLLSGTADAIRHCGTVMRTEDE
jgi:hypothetical protein